jgi:hypothetical protein
MVGARHEQVFPLNLMRMMIFRTGVEEALIFRGFNGKLVKTSPEKTSRGMNI